MSAQTDERQRQRSYAGRKGALTRWYRHPDKVDDMQVARDAFRASFERPHACKACPEVIMPDGITDARRRSLAEQTRKQHYANLRDLAVASRRANV